MHLIIRMMIGNTRESKGLEFAEKLKLKRLSQDDSTLFEIIL